MEKLNFAAFKLNTHQLNSVFGGQDPVTTSQGQKEMLEDGRYMQRTDGYNDDNNDNKHDKDNEGTWESITIHTPPK